MLCTIRMYSVLYLGRRRSGSFIMEACRCVKTESDSHGHNKFQPRPTFVVSFTLLHGKTNFNISKSNYSLTLTPQQVISK